MEPNRALAELSILWYAEDIASDVDILVQIVFTMENRDAEASKVRVQDLCQIFGPPTEYGGIDPAALRRLAHSVL